MAAVSVVLSGARSFAPAVLPGFVRSGGFQGGVVSRSLATAVAFRRVDRPADFPVIKNYSTSSTLHGQGLPDYDRDMSDSHSTPDESGLKISKEYLEKLVRDYDYHYRVMDAVPRAIYSSGSGLEVGAMFKRYLKTDGPHSKLVHAYAAIADKLDVNAFVHHGATRTVVLSDSDLDKAMANDAQTFRDHGYHVVKTLPSTDKTTVIYNPMEDIVTLEDYNSSTLDSSFPVVFKTYYKIDSEVLADKEVKAALEICLSEGFDILTLEQQYSILNADIEPVVLGQLMMPTTDPIVNHVALGGLSLDVAEHLMELNYTSVNERQIGESLEQQSSYCGTGESLGAAENPFLYTEFVECPSHTKGELQAVEMAKLKERFADNISEVTADGFTFTFSDGETTQILSTDLNFSATAALRRMDGGVLDVTDELKALPKESEIVSVSDLSTAKAERLFFSTIMAVSERAVEIATALDKPKEDKVVKKLYDKMVANRVPIPGTVEDFLFGAP